MPLDILSEAKDIINTEITALETMRNSLDDVFLQIVDKIVNCKGKVIITGMGKPGHIGRKIAATMASLGTQSFFLHPAEALHGDLGMVSKKDVIIAISFSGESEEVIRLIPSIKVIGATLIGISGNENSTLIKHSDIGQIFPEFKEACNLGLAPTSSTTVALVFGDALAVVASKIYGFTEENFGLYHPAGSLGKRLFVTAKDIMAKGNKNAVVNVNSKFKDAIIQMSQKNLGIVNIVDENNNVKGIITDGDIRRLLEKNVDIYDLNVCDIMTKSPTLIDENVLAVEIIRKLRKKGINSAPIVDKDKKLVGCLTLHTMLDYGIT